MSEARGNVLLLIADDLGKYVGCYGCASTHTPNIDRLAAEGVKFDLAFASTASCSGSRSTLYTGLHTHENGQYGLNIFRTHFQTFPHVETAPKLFNPTHHTGILGKVHVGPDAVYPWTYNNESESRDVAWLSDCAEDFFKESKSLDKPFFLTVGFIDPHRDVTTRGGFGNSPSPPFDSRVTHRKYEPEDVEVPSWLPDLPETRRELAEYYEAIDRTDQGVGMILDALDRQGLRENTMVIFTSDNGPPFLNAKTTLYDAGTCLPFIVRTPGGPKGMANPNMISYIDVLPTIMEYAGVSPSSGSEAGYQSLATGAAKTPDAPPPRRGRSFLGILRREDVLPASEWQHHVYGSHTFHELQNYWPTRVIRTRRWKYHRNIAWRLDFPFSSDLYASLTFGGIRRRVAENESSGRPGPGMIGSRRLDAYIFRPAEELFDLANDPDELVNLAAEGETRSAATEEVLFDLRRKLEHWQQETHDLWLYRDSVSVTMLRRYAKDGLCVPDRFDMDASGRVGEHMERVDRFLG